MGRSVDLHRYNFGGLVNDIAATVDTDRTDIIKDILLVGGECVGDEYILLNNEFWEDYNSYYILYKIINEVFNRDDDFGKTFDCFCYNRKESVGWHEMKCAASYEEYSEMLSDKYGIKV